HASDGEADALAELHEGVLAPERASELVMGDHGARPLHEDEERAGRLGSEVDAAARPGQLARGLIGLEDAEAVAGHARSVAAAPMRRGKPRRREDFAALSLLACRPPRAPGTVAASDVPEGGAMRPTPWSAALAVLALAACGGGGGGTRARGAAPR